jgi:hypothetical protein
VLLVCVLATRDVDAKLYRAATSRRPRLHHLCHVDAVPKHLTVALEKHYAVATGETPKTPSPPRKPLTPSHYVVAMPSPSWSFTPCWSFGAPPSHVLTAGYDADHGTVSTSMPACTAHGRHHLTSPWRPCHPRTPR